MSRRRTAAASAKPLADAADAAMFNLLASWTAAARDYTAKWTALDELDGRLPRWPASTTPRKGDDRFWALPPHHYDLEFLESAAPSIAEARRFLDQHCMEKVRRFDEIRDAVRDHLQIREQAAIAAGRPALADAVEKAGRAGRALCKKVIFTRALSHYSMLAKLRATAKLVEKDGLESELAQIASGEAPAHLEDVLISVALDCLALQGAPAPAPARPAGPRAKETHHHAA